MATKENARIFAKYACYFPLAIFLWLKKAQQTQEIMSKMNVKDLGFVHKKIHPQVIKSVANLLFNTNMDMYTKNLVQVRRSKEGKLQIPGKLYIIHIYIYDRWIGLTQVSHNVFLFATSWVTSCLFIQVCLWSSRTEGIETKEVSSADSLKHQWCYNERLQLCIVRSKLFGNVCRAVVSSKLVCQRLICYSHHTEDCFF